MRDKSAGIILYRIRNNLIEFLVCHTGGPYGKGTDQDRWSIPKGKIEDIISKNFFAACFQLNLS